MILLNDACSIIESIYLGRKLTSDRFSANIIVNPKELFYENKIIWINSANYDLSILSELSKKNTIKSRIRLNNASFKYRLIPYRSDRIKRLSLKLINESDYSVSRYDTSKIIIFEDTKGDLATILPKSIEINKVRNKFGMSAYELYLTLINNSFDHG